MIHQRSERKIAVPASISNWEGELVLLHVSPSAPQEAASIPQWQVVAQQQLLPGQEQQVRA